ncbi:MAG: hypothetical protein LBS32_03470 [Clostridiales Family XIII bacterium]|nr:hypothetical protein [Clostridiales Family XIII bacterium]
MKNYAFKEQFNSVVDNLRSEIFEDRTAMRLFCSGIYSTSLGERGTGFKLQNAGYSYYLRCKPGESDYDAYLFVYDDRYLLPELAGKHALPDFCYSAEPSAGGLILIKPGERGYY